MKYAPANFGEAIRLAEQIRHRLFDRQEWRIQNEYKELRRRYYQYYWELVCDRSGWELECMGSDFFRIHGPQSTTYTSGYYVQIDSLVLLEIAGNKVLSQRLLGRAGLPIPRNISFSISSIDKAKQFMAELGRPIVVKPVSGGGGKGVTTDIRDEEAMRKAVRLATQSSPQLLAEEQIFGDNYRFLYIDGALIDAIRRDPPTIVGDGSSTIKELIQKENLERLRGTPFTALSALTEDCSVNNCLQLKGLSKKHVIPVGESLSIKSSINQNAARDNKRILNDVHSSYRDLGRRIQEVLDIKLLGLDIITPSIDVALEDSGGAINEINTTPAFHHHDFTATRDHEPDVGQLVIEYCLNRNALSNNIAPN